MSKRIGITMRVDTISYPSGASELRDALSQDWGVCIEELLPNILLIPLLNRGEESLRLVKELEIEAIIFSGGNDLYSNTLRDKSEFTLLDYAIEKKLPCLGICRGMQVMNVHQHGTLSKIADHVAREHEVIFDKTKESVFVNSYHSYGIYEENIAKDFEVLAYSLDNNKRKSIEAFKHKTFSWIGLMWHIERNDSLSCIDKKLIKEYLEL